jgi:hypothetical protein
LVVFFAAGWPVRNTPLVPSHADRRFTCSGLALVVRNTAIFDDAYYSFRCARNLVDGSGLVFNPGQYFEIYTKLSLDGMAGAESQSQRPESGNPRRSFQIARDARQHDVVYKIGLALNARATVLSAGVLVLALQYYFMSYGTSVWRRWPAVCW